MKLTKKLLPLVAVATCASSCIPFTLTSCSSNKSYFYDFSNGDIVWSDKIGQFDFSRLDVDKPLQKQIEDYYWQDVNNNKEIFASDFAVSSARKSYKAITSMLYGDLGSITELSYKISDIKFEDAKYESTNPSDPNELNTKTVSFTNVIKVGAKETMNNDIWGFRVINYSGEVIQTIKNCPIDLVVKQEDGTSFLELVGLPISAGSAGQECNIEAYNGLTTPWSIDYDLNLSIQIKYVGSQAQQDEYMTFNSSANIQALSQFYEYQEEIESLSKGGFSSIVANFVLFTFCFDFDSIYMSPQLPPC